MKQLRIVCFLIFCFFPPVVFAVPCQPTTSDDVHYVLDGVACLFPHTIDGVDAGAEEEDNSAVLTLKNGTTITIQNNQNLAFGSIIIESGSQIVRPTAQKGPIFLGKPMYYSDAIDEDNDGVPISGGEISFIKDGKKRKGKNQPYVGEYDCDDTEKKIYQMVSVGTDSDQDGYIVEPATAPACVGDTTVVEGRTYYKDASNHYIRLADIVGPYDCDDDDYDPSNTCQ